MIIVAANADECDLVIPRCSTKVVAMNLEEMIESCMALPEVEETIAFGPDAFV